jgi:hypothetical protein
MRILGKEGMQAVYENKNGEFTSPEVLKAFQLYKEFATLRPFQKGTCQTPTQNRPALSTTAMRLST